MRKNQKDFQLLKEFYKDKTYSSIVKDIIEDIHSSLNDKNFSYYKLAINTFSLLVKLKRNNIFTQEEFKKIMIEVEYQIDDLITHSAIQLYKDGVCDVKLETEK